MPIHEVNSTWFLETPHSTYVVGITAEGFLQHLHWGGPIRPCDLARLRPRVHRAFAPNIAGTTDPALSLQTLPAEFPFPGSGDFRSPAIEVAHADGNRVLCLRYCGHRIRHGKPGLAGLPATYVEHENEADMLEVDLLDEPSGLKATLSYCVFAGHNALTRSIQVTNTGTSPCTLLRLLSASVDFSERRDWRWLQLSGAWARERHVHASPLRPGMQSIESRSGASGHEHNPFFALLGPAAGEEQGEVFGFSLVYSGNFFAGIELDAMDTARAQIGLNFAGFSWQLEPGETFQAPETVLVYSAGGLGEMSRTYHRLYRTRLCRGRHRDAERPTLVNNWEATYFDFDAARLVDLARRARAVGVELFVLDDGWFGHRNDDRSSLGDWQADLAKLPGGLPGLVADINREGLAFGLWFEPEMVSPDSELYRLHPDWCLHVPGRPRSRGRNQLVLDFSRAEVREAVYRQIAAILQSAPIRYVKWDMNRHLTEVASAGRPAARQTETAHRHILGLYAFLETLVTEFPEILFESCSGGGGRFDPGLLFYMPQTWTSDNSDAISRLKIQYGTSLVYPLAAMAAHISITPNHQTGRTAPLHTRGLVAMTGAFGLELDLAKCSAAELDEIAELVARQKQWRRLLADGNLYRLKNPFLGDEAAWMVVSPDHGEALVFHVRLAGEANASLQCLRLRGLCAGWNYRDTETGEIFGGDGLMFHGLISPPGGDFSARAWHFKRERPDLTSQT
ncbi:MAG: Alpha-galactosidase [Lacunisphaera sp.]|nr:Alpha-galactosidase [Lacunisphaera sp.]